MLFLDLIYKRIFSISINFFQYRYIYVKLKSYIWSNLHNFVIPNFHTIWLFVQILNKFSFQIQNCLLFCKEKSKFFHSRKKSHLQECAHYTFEMTIFAFIHQAVKWTFLFTKIKVLCHVHARDKKKNFENYATASHKNFVEFTYWNVINSCR